MHRFKKTLVWLLMAVLLASAFPGQFARQASAATPTAATYFIPDLKTLRDTALLTTDVPASNTITRDNVYQTSSGKLTITGTYSYVSSDSMAVKVEQLISSPNGSWTTDSTHVTTSSVTADTGSTNRFTASNLPLFSGFNKITFTGLQGSVTRSDVFYVLYDSVPYVKSLKVNGGSNGSINLNEGTQVVMDSPDITLQGVVQNATKVTLSLNGATPLLTSLLDDGTFFTPAVTLKAGINTVSFVISNTSDSITISRVIYYYDANHPFTKLSFVNGGTDYPLLGNNVPIVTGAIDASPYLNVQFLVPYDSVAFLGGGGSYSLNGGAYQTVAAATDGTTSETVIAGSDSVTPAYRLVSFRVPYTGIAADGTYPANVAIKYGSGFSFTASQAGQFNYRQNDTVIQNMYYLSGFTPGDSISDANKVPLNGAEVLTPDFYILVETDNDPGLNDLTGSYVPGATAVAITGSTAADLAADGTQHVYKISGFASGQQTVKFQYDGSTAYYNANISYASQSYIYISNLYDGQTYTFDSSDTSGANKLSLSGQFVGFGSWGSTTPEDNIQMFINGTVIKNSDGSEFKPVLTQDPSNPNNYAFGTAAHPLDLIISESGPLIYGQNRIKFTATTTDASGNVQVVSKEIRVNIIDENVSKIASFLPTAVPIDGREPFSTDTALNATNYPDTKLAKIFAVSPDFVFADDKYTTSQQKFDLVLRGSGARNVNLYLGSDLFGHIDLSTAPTSPTGTFVYQNTTYTYHIAGDSNDFIVRVEDLTFDEPGSKVFNLELINETGARTIQKLEVDRVVEDYRLLSPQPTVGDQIVVNKNFVHFDIEAEGATSVTVDKAEATKRSDYDDRFIYDYVGLKPNKTTAIKIVITRSGSSITKTVNVYYTDTVQIDSQYMQALQTKNSIFNKDIQLSFPKGTVLQSAPISSTDVAKFYPDQMLLYGIADDQGIVERTNDYGNAIGAANAASVKGQFPITVPDFLISNFQSTANNGNFSKVSDVYWISGGVGELGSKGSAGYEPAMNGVTPFAIDPYATSGDATLKFTEIPATRKIVPSQRGELTLAFDPNIVDDAGTTVTVFRYTDSGKWENVGGEVDMKSHTITVPFDQFGYYMVMKMRKGFSDITNHTWARNILNALYAKGIMNATQPPTIFGADDETTRGEFATLIVKGLNLPINSDDNQTFYDVLPGVSTATWSYDYIETAARAGIINGITEGFFNPEGKLTREEAAVMIARAVQLKMPTNDDKLETQLSKSFLDSDSIQYYARPAISAVSKAAIMVGSPVTVGGKTQYNFNPKGNMTRAEAGKIAVALLEKSTNLFPATLS